MFVEDKEKFILPLVVKKADPWTLEHLVQWLETMPPEGSYRFECTDGSCLIGQYSAAHGFGKLTYYEQVERIKATGQIEREERINITHFERVAVRSPQTFGAALTRALAALERLPRSLLQAEGGK